MDRPRHPSVQRGRERRLVSDDGRPVRRPLIDDPELHRMRAADRARDAELHPLSPAGKRRWRMYVAAAVVFFPLATYIFTPAGFNDLWFQLLVAVAYGTYVAFARPAMVMCALVTVAAGLAIQAYTGVIGRTDQKFLLVLSLFLYGTVGLLVGFREHDKQIDR